ncbi:hypothetical protein VKT23_019793 [Stygiomarasmius scandens]|uniref:Uncharacterized protein n=1 Tax=Marasmiellus scandens TaxID=2682957 RepID=A0ABR1IKJ2_9AGAR
MALIRDGSSCAVTSQYDVLAVKILSVSGRTKYYGREQTKVLVDKWHQTFGPSSATKSTINGGDDPAAGEAKPVNGDTGARKFL